MSSRNNSNNTPNETTTPAEPEAPNVQHGQQQQPPTTRRSMVLRTFLAQQDHDHEGTRTPFSAGSIAADTATTTDDAITVLLEEATTTTANNRGTRSSSPSPYAGSALQEETNSTTLYYSPNNSRDVEEESKQAEEEEENDIFPTTTPAKTDPTPGQQQHHHQDQYLRSPICPMWTCLMEDGLHKWIRDAVTAIAIHAANHPWMWVIATVIFSFGISFVGLATNFVVVFDHSSLFTPMDSMPAKHGQWFWEESGFVESADMLMIVHADGSNVGANADAIRKAFEVLETLQGVEGYEDVCAQSPYKHPFTHDHTCWVWSVTQFWENNLTYFEERSPNPLELLQVLSQPVFPDGIPVYDEIIFGKLERISTKLLDEDDLKEALLDVLPKNESEVTNTKALLKEVWNTTREWYEEYGLKANEDIDLMTYTPAFMIAVGFPDTDATYEFQERALLELHDLQTKWEIEATATGGQDDVTTTTPDTALGGGLRFVHPSLQDDQQEQDQQLLEPSQPPPIHLDFFCSYAYALEYERALVRDMPLVLVIFLVMLSFTMFVFHKYGQHKKSSASATGCNGSAATCGTEPQHSRATLGLASIITIGMSMMSGFGMLFCWGVPFTNITLMAPFIILGIGLDDTFIITGAYFRRLREFHTIQREAAQQQQAAASKKKTADVDDGTPQPPTTTKTRKQQQEEVVERIRGTMQEVGLSISLTTLTTTFAFVLGCISTVPGIRWLCLYSSVTVVFDFLYQISFFVALLVLDERRIAGTLLRREEDGKRPALVECLFNYCCCCCCWCCCCFGFSTNSNPAAAPGKRTSESATAFLSSSINDHHDRDTQLQQAIQQEEIQQEEEEFFMDRIMRWYAKHLMKPFVKALVLVVFLGCFAANVYSTTKLEQRFNIVDYVPKDSYTRPFFDSMDKFSSIVVSIGLYFRNVDQSDENVQLEMIDYIEEMSKLPQFNSPPKFCWVRDLHELFSAEEDIHEALANSKTFQAFGPHKTDKLVYLLETLSKGNYTFEEKLNLAMNLPGLRDMYGEDIIRDEEGKITASRCFLFVHNLSLQDVEAQIDMLHDTREVTLRQPINQLPGNQDELPFFAYDDMFAYWQLYTVAVKELAFTTIVGVVAVCFVGFIIIPNWTAVLFVGPLIIMLYFNLLGTMQACGIYINAVTYVTVVISIGLLVDFLMHILLRYYETKQTTREAKVKETLETMGASMMLGGFTTWLGVIPMAFSTTKIFYTLFIAFLAMVTWGLLVGLVLLPVLLSIWGPEITRSSGSASEETTPRAGNNPKETFRRSTRSLTEEEPDRQGRDANVSAESSTGGYLTPLQSPMPSIVDNSSMDRDDFPSNASFGTPPTGPQRA